jgi:hypothetical protein
MVDDDSIDINPTDNLPKQRWESDQLDRNKLDCVWSAFKDKYDTPEKSRLLLQRMSQHQSMLAFQDITFGGDGYGIFGLTPTDGLHCVKLGLWKYIASHVISLMGQKPRSQIDQLITKLIKPQRQIEGRYFPR